GATETGGGETIADGAATFFDAASQTFTLDNYTLDLKAASSTGAFAGDAIDLNDSAQLIVDTGVTFTDQGTSGTAFTIGSAVGTPGTLTIDGVYDKTGSGTTEIDVAVTNGGTANVQAGSLEFDGAITNNGTLEATGTGTLSILGSFTNAATIDANGGTVTF